MFGFVGGAVLKAGEGAFNVPGHADVARAFSIIPLHGEDAITGAAPIAANLVVGFKGGEKMLGVAAFGVADAKVIDNEAEDDVACRVAPVARCQRNGFVPVWCKKIDKLIICQPIGLREAVHATSDLNIDMAVVYEGAEIVLC